MILATKKNDMLEFSRLFNEAMKFAVHSVVSEKSLEIGEALLLEAKKTQTINVTFRTSSQAVKFADDVEDILDDAVVSQDGKEVIITGVRRDEVPVVHSMVKEYRGTLTEGKLSFMQGDIISLEAAISECIETGEPFVYTFGDKERAFTRDECLSIAETIDSLNESNSLKFRTMMYTDIDSAVKFAQQQMKGKK